MPGFAYFDQGKKRFWMSVGNVRTALRLEERGEKDVLKAHLERNAICESTQAETVFPGSMEQRFAAVQTPPNFMKDELAEVDSGK